MAYNFTSVILRLFLCQYIWGIYLYIFNSCVFYSVICFIKIYFFTKRYSDKLIYEFYFILLRILLFVLFQRSRSSEKQTKHSQSQHNR